MIKTYHSGSFAKLADCFCSKFRAAFKILPRSIVLSRCTEFSVIRLHAAVDPVQHHTHKAVFVELCDQRLVLPLTAASRHFFLYHIRQQIVGQLIEIALDLLLADRVINIQNKRLVLQYRLKDLLQTFTPRTVRLLIRKRTLSVPPGTPTQSGRKYP